MEEIKLPTYEVLIPNQLFRKKGVCNKELPECYAEQITKLTRYRVPKKEEIIDFIRQTAERIQLNPREQPIHSKEKSPTADLLKKFPKEELEKISKGDVDTLIFLRENYPRNFIKEERPYLNSFNGIIPTNLLDYANEFLKEEDRIDFYNGVIGRYSRNIWNISIKLLGNSELPNKSKLENLISAGVRDSDLFRFQGKPKSYQSAVDQIDLFYNVLTPKRIASIPDLSHQILEQRAYLAVMNVIKEIIRNKLVNIILRDSGNFLPPLNPNQRNPKRPDDPQRHYLN